MFSPLPQSPLLSPTYNQNLNVPLYEDDEVENENPENHMERTNNYTQSETNNVSIVYQNADYVPKEEEVPPLQPRHLQVYSPLPRYQQSPAMSPYNQDLFIPLNEEAENNSNGNYQTGNYRQFETENLSNAYQNADYFSKEDEVPPLQPRNSQVSDQSHVFENTQNNFGQMIIVRQEDNVLNPSETYHNPPQAMDNEIFYGSSSPHHQENTNIPIDYNDFLQEANSMNIQNSRPVLSETSYYGESSSSHPIQNQTDQSERRGTKRPIVETLDDHNETYEYFYNITSMDTKQIVQLVNDKLLELDIHQSVFAEKVLGRTQGTASDLLKKPKSWKDLKSGRDTYRRMYMFLMLYNENMKRIEIMSRNEVQQMMNCPPIPEKEKPKNKQTTKKTTENNQNEEPQPKRSRIVFDANQINQLEGFYLQNPRPSRDTMEQIAREMRLPYNTVYNWFMNRRRREKEEKNDAPQLTYPVYTVYNTF